MVAKFGFTLADSKKNMLGEIIAIEAHIIAKTAAILFIFGIANVTIAIAVGLHIISIANNPDIKRSLKLLAVHLVVRTFNDQVR